MDRSFDRDLASRLPSVLAAPDDAGPVEMIVRRPRSEAREVVDEGRLTVESGLVGDDWLARGSRSTPDGAAHPEAQLTLMSSRVLAAVAADRAAWPLAGDQLIVDLDLSVGNLPPGSRLAVGEAEVVVSELPHTGCAKFSARFGSDALRWLNTPEGRENRLRGVYVRVTRDGTVRTGDLVRKLPG